MKRTIIALVAGITATLIPQPSEKLVAANSIPSPIIGIWQVVGNRNTLRLSPDGSYSFITFTFGPPGGAYAQCSTTVINTNAGSFAVDGNEIKFNLQTHTLEKFAGCATGFPVNLTPVPKIDHYSNKYFGASFSFQNNGQTLVLTGTGGDTTTASFQKIKNLVLKTGQSHQNSGVAEPVVN